MRLYTLITFLAYATSPLWGQTFEEIPVLAEGGTDFVGAERAGTVAADLDGDGDVDYVIAGLTPDGDSRTTVYVNDGTGGFSPAGASGLPDTHYGGLAAGDLDGDGDVDVLVTGQTVPDGSAGDAVTAAYLNDGDGAFSPAPGNGFTAVFQSAAALADVDGDGDLDAAVAGRSTGGLLTALYLNDGDGGFSRSSVSLPAVVDGSLAFTDTDGTGGVDLVVAGRGTDDRPLTRLYLNDGSGAFALASANLQGAAESAIGIGDLDGDGTEDIVLAGFSSTQRDLVTYLNDGGGAYTRSRPADFVGVNAADVALGDIDGDGDLDLFVAGFNANRVIELRTYVNDGTGGFAAEDRGPIADVFLASLELADVTGDGALDLLTAGADDAGAVANAYVNDGRGTFATVSPVSDAGLVFSSADFGDVDGDGDDDFVSVGLGDGDVPRARLYRNDDSDRLVASELEGVTPVFRAATVLGDLDGDGRPDLIAIGRTDANTDRTPTYFAGAYRNRDGRFEAYPDHGLPALGNAAAASADVDGDGDLDVALIGRARSGAFDGGVFLNDGTGRFTPAAGNDVRGLVDGALAFADLDGDGDVDLVAAGRNEGQAPQLFVHVNDGAGGFVIDAVRSASLTPVAESSIAAAAFDGDGDVDLALAGFAPTGRYVGIHLNDGAGFFREDTRSTFLGVNRADLAATEIDGENGADLVVVGYDNARPVTRLYLNGGDAAFALASRQPFPNVQLGRVAFGDVDGEGLLDLVLIGSTSVAGDDGAAVRAYLNSTPVTGVSESEAVGTLRLFPNPAPAQQRLRIDYDGYAETPVDVLIHGVDGRRVRAISGATGLATRGIDIGTLGAGAYVVTVVDGGRRFAMTLVVE